MIRIICLLFIIAALLAMCPFAIKQHFIQQEQDIADQMMIDQIAQSQRTNEKLRREGKLNEASEPNDGSREN